MQTGQQKEKRLVSLTMFDMLKGLLMLGVIALHTAPGDAADNVFWNILYSAAMPVFFITSGYWLKKKNWKAGIKEGAKYLLKPYFYAVFLIILVGGVHRFLIHEMEEWRSVFLLPSVLMLSGDGSRLGPLWFLPALFLAWSLYYVVMGLENERLRLFLALLSGIVGGYLSNLRLPFQLAQGLVGFFYVYCGFLIKKKKLWEKKMAWYQGALLLAIWLAAVLWGKLDLGSYRVERVLLSEAGSLAGSVLLIYMFLRLNRFENLFTAGLQTVGRYTMWILCVHGVEGALVPWNSILARFVDKETFTGWLLWMALRCAVIAAGCTGLGQLENRRRRDK